MSQQAQNGSQPTAITDVRVFDGNGLTDPTTVLIEEDRIVDGAGGDAVVVDGSGATLLPGLIDAHIHLDREENLRRARSFGVTTMIDMASHPASLTDSLRHRHGLTDILSAGIPASAPGGIQTTFMGFPADSALERPDQAEPFVAARAEAGSDFIKLIVENPQRMGEAALDQPTLDALVASAHAHGLRTVAHASSATAQRMALDAGVDILTHAPLDEALDEESLARMVTDEVVSIPTLTMMKTLLEVFGKSNAGPNADYVHAKATVSAMYARGIPILAGTDANDHEFSPAKVPHGQAMHDELELLVEAGLSTLDALRAATVLPARYFELLDRGSIEVGQRADLVLIAGDPIQDIRATRQIRDVWCGGVRESADRHPG